MNKSTLKLGYYAAICSFVFAVAYVIAQLLQVAGLIIDPLGAILIYGTSLGIATPFLLAMLALHYSISVQKRIWSHAALLFTVLYVGYVNINYVVQLTTVLPALSKGELGTLAVINQTPHSMFWDVDALGYINMGIATLLAAPVFRSKGIELWAKRFFIANAIMTPIIGYVYFYPTFSSSLLMIGLPWAITAPGSILLLALYFRKKMKQELREVMMEAKEALVQLEEAGDK